MTSLAPPAVRSEPATTTPPRRRRRYRHGWQALLYIGPGFVFIAAFLLYPMVQTLWYSLFEWDGLSVATWVGIDNYVRVLTDARYLEGFAHVLVLVFFYAVVPIVVALLLAAVMNRGQRIRGGGVFRTMLFLPQVVTPVVVGLTWTAIYAPQGMLNSFLETVGLSGLTRAWLGEFDTALIAVGFIGTWVQVGLCLVLFLAGMAQIPRELYDAARTDGAGPVREFFSVTLPGIRAQIAVALTLTVISAIRTFDLIYVTTSGGPGRSTSVPAFEIYNLAFNQGQIGMACAIGVVLTILIFIVTVLIGRVQPREDGE